MIKEMAKLRRDQKVTNVVAFIVLDSTFVVISNNQRQCDIPSECTYYLEKQPRRRNYRTIAQKGT